MSTATGTFEIEMTPAASEISDAVGRFNFTKTFRGDLEATGVGIMLSAGTPQAGEAGYVAMEAVEGRLNGLVGGFALQQFGTVHDGAQPAKGALPRKVLHLDLGGYAATQFFVERPELNHATQRAVAVSSS